MSVEDFFFSFGEGFCNRPGLETCSVSESQSIAISRAWFCYAGLGDFVLYSGFAVSGGGGGGTLRTYLQVTSHSFVYVLIHMVCYVCPPNV